MKELYHSRWDVELFFKILNHDLKLKSSSMETLNTLQQDIFAKLIVIVISKIIALLVIEYSREPLKENKKINFSNCTDVVTHEILRIFTYDKDHKTVVKKTVECMKNIRNTDTDVVEGRKFERIAARKEFKWYAIGYNNKNIKKNKLKRAEQRAAKEAIKNQIKADKKAERRALIAVNKKISAKIRAENRAKSIIKMKDDKEATNKIKETKRAEICKKINDQKIAKAEIRNAKRDEQHKKKNDAKIAKADIRNANRNDAYKKKNDSVIAKNNIIDCDHT